MKANLYEVYIFYQKYDKVIKFEIGEGAKSKIDAIYLKKNQE